jgi:ribosomal protein S18 acetylase RimI-like enzyme
MITIRRALAADAPALAAIGRATFAAAFAHLYWPEDLEAFLAGAYTRDKMRHELADPRFAVWLALSGAEVVGYAVAGPCDLPHPEVTSACGELKRVYVAAGAQGGGTGSRLVGEALAWLERDGPRRIWIGVWSGNLGARRLYERLGFEKVGEYYFQVGQARDREFILRRG